jgi:predicted kinase
MMTIFLIGPSYVGKSTFAKKFTIAHPEIYLLSFQKYRSILYQSKFIYFREVFCFIFRWWRVIFVLLSSRCCWHAALLHRVLKFGFIHFLLLRSRDSIKNNVCLFDEDFVKKLIDSTPTTQKFSDYTNIKIEFSLQIHKLVHAYLKSINLRNTFYIIADCPYSVAKEQAKHRYKSEGHSFIERDFRNRYTLERQIYRIICNTFSSHNVGMIVINTTTSELPSDNLLFVHDK